MKTSYQHVYLVPTRLLICRKNSHLHAYLVYTFIQYQGVYVYNIFETHNECMEQSLINSLNSMMKVKKMYHSYHSEPEDKDEQGFFLTPFLLSL